MNIQGIHIFQAVFSTFHVHQIARISRILHSIYYIETKNREIHFRFYDIKQLSNKSALNSHD